MSGQCLMKFFNVGRRKFSMLRNKVKKTFQYLLLIFENWHDTLGRFVCCPKGNQACLDTPFNQELSDASIYRIQILYNPGLNCPFPPEALIEPQQRFGLLQFSSRVLPYGRQTLELFG